MAAVAYVFACLLVLQSAHSYILLTANLEDVQALAQQLSESPVVDQIQKIWRRASDQFTQRVANNKIQLRANADAENDEIVSAEQEDVQGLDQRRRRGSDPAGKSARRSSRVSGPSAVGDDILSLGKLAGAHLESMKEIFKSV